MNICLIRHGMSLHNIFDQYLQKAMSMEQIPPSEREFIHSISSKDRKFAEDKKLKFDLRLIDPPLSELGIEQAKENQKEVNKLDVKYVLVSPLLRALQTSRFLFEKHPNKEIIKFIVVPMTREVISSINDLPNWTLKKTREEFEKIEGMHYDFSMFKEFPKPDLYFLYSLNEEEAKNAFKRIEEEGEENYVKTIQKIMLEKKVPGHQHHCKFETYYNARKRGILFADWTRKFIAEKGIKPEQVALVSHSNFICHMTATEFNDYGRVKVYSKPPFAIPYSFDLNKVPSP